MIHEEMIDCENCGETYAPDEIYCPICGAENPLLHLDDSDVLMEEEEEEEEEEEATHFLEESPPSPPQKRAWWRRPIGCFSIILFITLIGSGIVLGLYDGLRERAENRQVKVEEHYQRAIAYADDNKIELAIAELGQALTLNPSHQEARTLLTDLQAHQTETPTPTSVTRQNVAEELYNQSKELALQGDWQGVVDTLKQLRDINPNYQPAIVSEDYYTANYELGLRLVSEGKLPEALHAFDEALVERPNDPTITTEWEKVSLYLSLITIDQETDNESFENNLVILNQLYNRDPNFADVKDRLYNTYVNYANYLAGIDEWCLAQPRFEAAVKLFPDANIEALAADATFRCESVTQPTPVPTRRPDQEIASTTAEKTITDTESITATAEVNIALSAKGKIYFTRQNSQNNIWEIIAVDVATKRETVILSNGTQPAVSPNGTIMVYHSTIPDSLGLHSFNLRTGEDIRLTNFAEDNLARWGNSNQEFIFASQRSGDRRWEIYTGFVDGKGDPVVQRDGRTPALAPNGNVAIYQGTDEQGNNPGLYLLPQNGGETTRLTTHQSDRSPAVSTRSQVAFMSTRNGNWDIWTVPLRGGQARPLVTTPGNDGLPVWSPDGQTVAFVSDQDGTWGIYIVSASGGTPQKITNWGSTYPDWLLEQLSWP